MGLLKRSSHVDAFIAKAQLRFDLLREVQCLRAERLHHLQQIKRLDQRLAQLAKPLELALRDLQGADAGTVMRELVS